MSGTIRFKEQPDRKERRFFVSLHGATTPFVAETLTGSDGSFRFKNIARGNYTLIVSILRSGEMRRTIVVGPSFADARGRIKVQLEFERGPPSPDEHGIPASQFKISDEAFREYNRAIERLKRNDVEGARKKLERAVELSPQFSAAWNHLGTVAYQTGDYQRAEECFRESLRHDPNAYSPLVNLGGALISLKRLEEAIVVNQRAVALQPDDALARSQLGLAYFFVDRLQEAESQLQRAKALDPSHFTMPQLYLMEIYARNSRVEEATAEIESFLKLHPDSNQASVLRQQLERLRVRTQNPKHPF